MEFAMSVAAGAMGLLIHFIKKLIEYRKTPTLTDVREWFITNWLQSSLSIIVVCAYSLLLYTQGVFTPETAIAVGLAGSSAGDVVGKRKVTGFQK